MGRGSSKDGSVPVSGLLPWLCPLSSLEQQEVEGSGVLGVPSPKGRAGGSSLSIQPPSRVGPTQHPQAATPGLEADEHEAHRVLASALSPRRDRAREVLSAASAARPASSSTSILSARPCRVSLVVSFRTSRMNSGGLHKGPGTTAGATPEPAERTPHLTPPGSKTTAPMSTHPS